MLVLAILSLCLGISASVADVVTVVSSNSLVTVLTKDQIADIFLGKSNHFPDGTQAVPFDQPESSNVRDTFYVRVAGKSAAQIKANWARIVFTGRGLPPKIALNSTAVKKLLSANLLAISYMQESDVDSSVRVLRTP